MERKKYLKEFIIKINFTATTKSNLTNAKANGIRNIVTSLPNNQKQRTFSRKFVLDVIDHYCGVTIERHKPKFKDGTVITPEVLLEHFIKNGFKK